MHHFAVNRQGLLCCEDYPLREIARRVGTPAYVYSRATLEHHYRVFDEAFSGIPHIICFSMKANSNGSVVRTFTSMGSGVDIVSGGELHRALAAGAPPGKIVYSGVGKTAAEIGEALRRRILMFNVESREELERIDAIAGRMRMRAPISIRVNPDVDPKTHPYISTGLKRNKFGIHIEQAMRDYEWAARRRNIEVVGVDCHIGSQLTDLSPFLDAAGASRRLVDRCSPRGCPSATSTSAGGWGSSTTTSSPRTRRSTRAAWRTPSGARRDAGPRARARARGERGRPGHGGPLHQEDPVALREGEAPLLHRRRRHERPGGPSLYGSYHAILPAGKAPAGRVTADVVGPICESGDFLAKDRRLPPFKAGDLLAVMSAGPTASPCRRTTTAGRGPPRSWCRATAARRSASGKRYATSSAASAPPRSFRGPGKRNDPNAVPRGGRSDTIVQMPERNLQ